MNFANPRALHLLFFIIAGLCGSYFYSVFLRRRFSKWLDEALWPTVMPDFSFSVLKRKFIFLTLGLFFLLIAMARPQWGQHEEMIETKGMDVLFLLDLSNSMLAEDTPPSRLNRAQNFIRDLLRDLENDRAGIITFAGKAFLAVPLTNDFDYVTEMADTLDPSTMASQGTNIGQAIEVAIHAFERGAEDHHKQSRAVVLISDGEDFGESAMKGAAKLKDFGSGFFTLSVGTSEGAPIPIRNESGVLQTYKKDFSQKTVLSRVNRPLLASLAEAGGGTHVELINPEDAAYTVAKALKSMSRDDQKSKMEVVRIDRFQYFLALALFFFMLHLFTGYLPARWRAFVLLLILASPASEAQSFSTYLNSKKAENAYQKKQFDDSVAHYEEAKKTESENPVLGFNQGTALARSKRIDEALIQLAESEKRALGQGDFETAAKALYNEGLLHSEQKNMQESFDRLTKAIELAKRSGQSELEEKARQALTKVFEKQQQQSKEKQQSKDQQSNDQGQDKKPPQDSKQDKGKSGENEKPADSKPRKPQGNQPDQGGKNRQFNGSTLSKDVAESIMNDLSDREKQLYQRRLGDRKPREAPNDKDW